MTGSAASEGRRRCCVVRAGAKTGTTPGEKTALAEGKNPGYNQKQTGKPVTDEAPTAERERIEALAQAGYEADEAKPYSASAKDAPKDSAGQADRDDAAGLTNAIGQPIIQVDETLETGRKPNSIYELHSKKGGVTRDYYDERGRLVK